MSSAACADINRRNAARSTGPKTKEGKSQSAQNAIKHGLSSDRRILPWESEAEYEALQLTFNEQYRPGSDMECELLDRMVDCWWKLQRVSKVEDQFLLQREQAIALAHPGISGHGAVALMFSDPKETARLKLMMRYISQAERAWNRALADFEKARKERLAREKQEAILEAAMYPEFEDRSPAPETPEYLTGSLPVSAPGSAPPAPSVMPVPPQNAQPATATADCAGFVL